MARLSGPREQETTSLSEDLEMRRRRALYRAAHRGTKEMDLLMGRFAEAHIPTMDETELGRFEELLAQPDPDLQAWIMADGVFAVRAAPAPELNELIQSLKSFHGLA